MRGRIPESHTAVHAQLTLSLQYHRKHTTAVARKIKKFTVKLSEFTSECRSGECKKQSEKQQ